jgi:hypothetical protein
MASLSKGKTFSTGETVEPADMHQLVDNATVTFTTADDTDNSTLEVSGNKFRVKDSGVTAAKLAATLDLSTKTVTLPDDSVTNDKLSLSANDGEIKKAINADNAPPIYACRAWVNFDGTVADNLAGTYTRTGTDVTIAATAHGLIVGNVVRLDFTGGSPTAAVDGTYTVTQVDDANTFHVTTAASGTSSGGTVSLLRRLIKGAGNVSSVTYLGSAGLYAVNFSVAMPDANYAASCVSTAAITRVESTATFTNTETCFRIEVITAAGAGVDSDVVNVIIFR